MSAKDWRALSLRASKVFTPSAPVDTEKLFAGRWEQVRQVIDAVNQKGQHAIIFGERGVGKTSLANVISMKLVSSSESFPLSAPRVNCDSTDTYSSLWKKVFDQIYLKRPEIQLGFQGQTKLINYSAAEEFVGDFAPDDIRQKLTILSSRSLLIVILDEFDRIADGAVRAAIADTVKTLSDSAISATIVLVGVADSVDELITQHHSIERALMQVRMPRMSNDELGEILDNGVKMLGLSIDAEARHEIAVLSKGLPHYTHLLGLHSAREAIDRQSLRITLEHVEMAISKGLHMAQQSIQSACHKATMSAHKDNIYSQVLLACALAKTDDLGYFSAADVRTPLRIITNKQYDIPSFSRHLYDFCEEGRGRVLQKTGIPHRYRFRFTNPLMQPFVIMQGKTSNLIDKDKLGTIKQLQG